MLADKISVTSGGKVFRRIKDLVDLYYISKVIDFEKGELLQTLESSKRSLDSFDGFLHHPDELRHAYEKFRFTGNVDKPPFEEISLRARKKAPYEHGMPDSYHFGTILVNPS